MPRKRVENIPDTPEQVNLPETQTDADLIPVAENGESEDHSPGEITPVPSPATGGNGRRVLAAAIKGITYALLVFVVVLLALIARERILQGRGGAAEPAVLEAEAAFSTPTAEEEHSEFAEIVLPPLALDQPVAYQGIPRLPNLHTTVPTRPRVEVITYTVQVGDTLFSIADKFGLKPETVLWGNFETLEDNPHLLRPEQVLNILPVDGTYYQWAEGDTLQAVAEFFDVEPQAILEYPGNRFDLTETSLENPGIEAGRWLIIPGGKRALKDWGPPAITRSNPASASYYGAGHCGSVYEGAIGTSTFVWPTISHTISGYSYNPGVHPAIDIAGSEGTPVYATDSGVIVYAGWSNYGYGYLIVIDHGNGWQSAYAHLSAVSVGCGQSVFQGGTIGAVGNTGNSYGAHLHFELVYGGAKLNPLDFLP
jgi:murein DD-endopeptidase MepM/ murein hydrolase activator NlpD